MIIHLQFDRDDTLEFLLPADSPIYPAIHSSEDRFRHMHVSIYERFLPRPMAYKYYNCSTITELRTLCEKSKTELKASSIHNAGLIITLDCSL